MRCKKKELSVLLVEEEASEKEEEGRELYALEVPENEVSPNVSINCIVGFTNSKTLKLVGNLGKGK